MQTQEADGWRLTMFINPKGVGKRMVMDSQKVKTRSESRRYRVADRLSWSRQAEWSGRRVQSPEQARVNTGRTRKRRMQKAGQRENHWLTWKTYKTNWHRETGNTGINTPGKISDTWGGDNHKDRCDSQYTPYSVL